MGGFFGVTSRKNILADVFFGTDYHSHLGTRSAGIAALSKENGMQRKIHNIGNSPFRTKFEGILEEMEGTSAIGTINDSSPQPLVVTSKLGQYAIAIVGAINNKDELIKLYVEKFSGQLNVNSSKGVNTTELVAAFINQKDSIAEGINYAQEMIDGTAVVIILTENNSIIVARDKWGRLPIHIGKGEDSYCTSFEPFAYEKLGYENFYELKPAEVVEINPDGMEILRPGKEEMRICSFLWSYFGYPTSTYEGVNVETMRYRNGEYMAEKELENGTLPNVDIVAGVPDSGTPHAIGFSNKTHMPFARPFIKYTPTWPRSFMPSSKEERNRIAKMKQIPVKELIKDKELLFIDDSIVRGTQLNETVEFLYENGAKAIHMRSACPPIMYGCKFLNFTRIIDEMELLTRDIIIELEGEEGLEHIEEYSDEKTERGKNMREKICEKLHLASLEFQSLEGLEKAIGLPSCKLCTYCWNGKE